MAKKLNPQWIIKIDGQTAYVAEPFVSDKMLDQIKFYMLTRENNTLVYALPGFSVDFDSSDPIHQALATQLYFIDLVNDPDREVTLELQDLKLPKLQAQPRGAIN